MNSNLKYRIDIKTDTEPFILIKAKIQELFSKDKIHSFQVQIQHPYIKELKMISKQISSLL